MGYVNPVFAGAFAYIRLHSHAAGGHDGDHFTAVDEGGPQMTLTDTAIRNVKPGDKPKEMYDERGLFLLVQPSGGKLWRREGSTESRLGQIIETQC